MTLFKEMIITVKKQRNQNSWNIFKNGKPSGLIAVYPNGDIYIATPKNVYIQNSKDIFYMRKKV